MPDYKEFSKEEEEIYDREINNLRELIKKGMTLPSACDRIQTEDPEMRQIIKDDILKIMIAELHYEKKMSFKDISLLLDVEMDDIIKANEIMIEDVMHTIKETHLNMPGSDMIH